MDKLAAKLAYKASRRPIGVYCIRNLVNDKVFIGSSLDLPSMFNQSRFQLIAGSHSNKELEADWKRYGTGKFEFEVLEEIVQDLDVGHNYATDLEALEDLWLEKLSPYGERGYNVPKNTRDDKLRMIASNNNI